MRFTVIGRPNGVGLLDLIITVVIFSLFVALAVPAYNNFANRGRVAGAIGDVGSLALAIERFSVNNNDRLPNTLNELPMDIPLDPWGNEYQYEPPMPGQPEPRVYTLGKDGQVGGEGENADISNFSLQGGEDR